MKKNLIFTVILLLVALVLIPQLSFPKVSAAYHSYAVIDANTGRLLLGENEHEQLPIASLTKMWTALVALEQLKLNDKIVISSKAATQEGSSIYLKNGEEVTVERLLYGLMLRSGNDAAYALAEHSAGSLEGFVDLMNEKAILSGLERTTFTNPSGLHHEDHLSTAYETAMMLKIAMENEDFRKIASTKLYRFENPGPNAWGNKHRLVRQYDKAISGKTGYTKAAGRTLATYFQDGDKSIIVVTLNSSDDWNFHRNIAERVFSDYEVETVVKEGTYEIAPDVLGEVTEPMKVLISKEEKDHVHHVVKMFRNPLRKNEAIWNVYLDDELIESKVIKIRRKE